MPWKWRENDRVFVELFESGGIGVVRPSTDLLTAEESDWIEKVAVPELRAEWDEHLRTAS